MSTINLQQLCKKQGEAIIKSALYVGKYSNRHRVGTACIPKNFGGAKAKVPQVEEQQPREMLSKVHSGASSRDINPWSVSHVKNELEQTL